MRRRTVAAVVLGLSLLAGCGGGEALSAAAEEALSRDVEAIAAAARAGDAVRLQELVGELRGHVAELEVDGEVSGDRAAEILAAAARVATDVAPPEPEPKPEPEPEPEPKPEPEPEVVVSVVPAPPPEEADTDEDQGEGEKKVDEGEGEEKGKGKGEGGKEEGKGD